MEKCLYRCQNGSGHDIIKNNFKQNGETAEGPNKQKRLMNGTKMEKWEGNKFRAAYSDTPHII